MPFQPHSLPGHLDDPDDEVLMCALPECARTFRKGAAFNLGHVYLHAAGEHPPRMCAEIEHFTCSHDHAVAMAQACLAAHDHAPWDGVAASDRWTHPALSLPAMACDLTGCGASPSGAAAHYIVVVYRMPGRGFAAHMTGIYAGCCAEHAKAAASAGMRDHTPAARHPSRRSHTNDEQAV